MKIENLGINEQQKDLLKKMVDRMAVEENKEENENCKHTELELSWLRKSIQEVVDFKTAYSLEEIYLNNYLFNSRKIRVGDFIQKTLNDTQIKEKTRMATLATTFELWADYLYEKRIRTRLRASYSFYKEEFHHFIQTLYLVYVNFEKQGKLKEKTFLEEVFKKIKIVVEVEEESEDVKVFYNSILFNWVDKALDYKSERESDLKILFNFIKTLPTNLDINFGNNVYGGFGYEKVKTLLEFAKEKGL